MSIRAKIRGALRRVPFALLALCFCVPVLLLLAGAVLFHFEASRSKSHYASLLASAAGAAAEQLAQKRHLLFSDANAIVLYDGFVEHCRLFQESESEQERDLVLARMAGLRKVYGYRSVSLLASDGRLLLRQGEMLDLRLPGEQLLFSAAIQNREAVETDLFRDEGGNVRWDYVVPLFSASRANQPIGFLILSLDVDAALMNLLLGWPLPASTGKLVLARREADSVLVLNPLKYDKDAALNLRLGSFGAERHLAAMVLETKVDRLSGIDYRATAFLGASRHVDESRWFVTAKMDEAEVLAAVFRQLCWFEALGALLGVLVIYLLRRTSQAERMAFEMDAQARRIKDQSVLQQFYELPFTGMAVYDVGLSSWSRCNGRLQSMLGSHEVDLLRKGLSEMIIPEERERFQARVLEVLENHLLDGFRETFQAVCSFHESLFIRIDLRPYRSPAGELEYLLAAVEDVTTQLCDDKRLRQSEARLRAVFDHAGAGIGVLDREGRWLRVNQRLCVITGYSEAELLGMDYLGITHPDDVQINRAMVERVWASPEGASALEKRYRRRDGLELWVEVSLSVYEEQGVSLLLSVVVDVSARKKAEQAVEAQKKRLQRAERIANFGNWEIDLGTQRVRASEGAAALYGLPGSEWSLERVQAIPLPEERARLDEKWAEIVRGGGSHSIEYRIRRPSDGSIAVLRSVAEFDASANTLFGVIHDVTERKQFEQRLEHLAQYDQLTELPNRDTFLRRLEQGLSRERRQHGRLAVLMLDLDRFKDINDSYGHNAGDELLRQVAHLLRSRLRAEDTLARLGGDEFGILIEDVSSTRAIDTVAAALQEVLRHTVNFGVGSTSDIGVSIGISLFPDHAEGALELMQHADAALYLAKADGRNAYRYYTEALTIASRRRLSVESRLHRALGSEGALQVYYQPQWDLNTGALKGAEALIRWKDPDEGMIPPGDFIPIAEESGLINSLTDWVLETACTFYSKAGIADKSGLHLAVNLSPRSFSDAGLAERILAIVNRTGYPASMLELELTESALMQEGASALNTLNALRKTGVRLALDDFGTGYSSLAYLRSFPLDVLKIDKCFVDSLSENAGGGADIVTAVIDLAHMLGFKALAEGVETEEQATFLRLKGCDMYQGYLGSKPLPAQEYLALVRRIIGQ